MDVKVRSWSWRLLSLALLVYLNLVTAHVYAQPRSVIFQAPDFTLQTLRGETVHLADLRGKVVLLNFWATWCVPCRTEMPAIEALYQRYKDRGFDVLAVNMDKSSAAGVEAFVKETGVTFRTVLDSSWTTARAYGVRGLPTSYFIDRTGNVVVRVMGERNWMDGASQTEVEGLLQDPGATEQH